MILNYFDIESNFDKKCTIWTNLSYSHLHLFGSLKGTSTTCYFLFLMFFLGELFQAWKLHFRSFYFTHIFLHRRRFISKKIKRNYVTMTMYYNSTSKTQKQESILYIRYLTTSEKFCSAFYTVNYLISPSVCAYDTH